MAISPRSVSGSFKEVMAASNLEHPEPLIAPEANMAHHTIRGFRYQMLRSMFTWITLTSKDQVLYLECAEDFDVTEPSQVDTIQVKSTVTSFSLRSPDVHDFLNRWWTTRISNKSRIIHSAFITTGGFAQERGSGFSDPGLVLWNKVSAVHEIDALRGLILTCAKLSLNLKQFVEKLPVEAFKSEFLDMITWTGKAENTQEIIDLILKELTQLFGKLEITLDCTDNVFDRLYVYVSERITAPEISERILTLDELERLVRESAATAVPRKEFNELKSKVESIEVNFAKALEGQVGSSVTLSSISLIKQLSKIPRWYLPRDKLVSRLIRIVGQSKLTVLSGLRRSGKTTVAIATVCIFKNENWVSVGMNTSERIRVTDRLEIVMAMLARDPEVSGVIFDSIDFNKLCDETDNSEVANIIDSIASSGIRVIFTSCDPMPALLKSSLSNPVSSEEVTLLTPDELDIWIREKGCPVDRIQQWKVILISETGRHPELLRARLDVLHDKNWPPPDLTDIGKVSEEVSDLRREARRLVSTLEFSQKELLYRLSLLKGSFDRGIAVQVATINPELDFPGEVFDALNGPWISEENAAKYRVTPTLSNVGKQIWPAARVADLNYCIADIYLNEEIITIDKLAWSIMHSFEGANRIAFMKCINSVLSCASEHRDDIDRYMSWLPLIDVHSVSKTLKLGSVEKCFFHSLRFRIAISQDTSSIDNIVADWKSDVEAIESTKLKAMLILHCYPQLVTYWDVNPSVLLGLLMELHRTQCRWESLQETDDLSIDLELPLWFKEDLFQAMMPGIFVKCRNTGDLRSLLNGLEELVTSEQKECFSIFENNEPFARGFIDAIWISESKTDNPHWDNCVELFLMTIALAREIGIKELALAAGRAIGIVIGEYKMDFEGAFHHLSLVEVEFGQSYLIHDGKAAVMQKSERYVESFKETDLSLKLLEESPFDDDSITFISARQAGISAGKANQWDFAHRFFNYAADAALRLGLSPQHFGLLVDAGYSLWKLGERSASLELLIGAFEMLSGLADQSQAFAQTRLAGHVLLTIKDELSSTHDIQIADVVPGMCGNPEPDKRLLDLEPLPIEMCWAIIADISVQIGACLDIVDEAESIVSNGKYPFAYGSVQNSVIRKSILIGDIHNLPKNRWKLLCSIGFVMNAKKQGISGNGEFDEEIPKKPPENVSHWLSEQTILAGLLIGHQKNQSCLDILNAWSESIKNDDTLSNAIGIAKRICKLKEFEIQKLMTDSSYSETERILASITCFTNQSLSPEILWFCHANILSTFKEAGLQDFVSPWLVQLISNQWRQRLEYRFILRNPQITVHDISAVIDTEFDHPTIKCSMILLKARHAIRANIHSEFISSLRDLAARR